MKSSDRYRSIFWPVLLIGFGLIWLLVNTGLLPGWSWAGLWRLWPLFLIAIGLDLLIARRSALVGALVALASLALIVVIILAGGFFGYRTRGVQVVTDEFSEPIGVAEDSEIELDFSVGPATVYPLNDENLLFDAAVTHIGEMDFAVSGTASKVIRLDERQENVDLGWFDLVDKDELKWDVGITKLIPVTLDIKGGVGESELDLGELLLADLTVDVGVGDLNLSLPASEAGYEVYLDGGVGATDIDIARGANVTITIDGSVGDVRIDLPSNAEVRVDASVGVGNIRLPSNFERVSGSDGNIVGDSGVWETSGYADADIRITIKYDGGVGDLIIR
ncbi:MAG: LiaF-related protein [Anaerolineales bacterium]